MLFFDYCLLPHATNLSFCLADHACALALRQWCIYRGDLPCLLYDPTWNIPEYIYIYIYIYAGSMLPEVEVNHKLASTEIYSYVMTYKL